MALVRKSLPEAALNGPEGPPGEAPAPLSPPKAQWTQRWRALVGSRTVQIGRVPSA